MNPWERFVKEAKADFEYNCSCMMGMTKEFVKTTIITWVPILIGLGIYNLLK